MSTQFWDNEIILTEPGFCSLCGGNLEFDECECRSDEVEYDDMSAGYDE